MIIIEPQTVKIFAGARNLMVKKFPYLTEEAINEIIEVCARNDGLMYLPEDDPNFVFGYWQFYPDLIDIVKDCDWPKLKLCDLRFGPILYIAVLVTPTPGYVLARDLIDALNPLAVCCHRYRKTGEFDFRLRQNKRFDETRAFNASSH